MPPTLEAWSLRPWTTREVPTLEGWSPRPWTTREVPAMVIFLFLAILRGVWSYFIVGFYISLMMNGSEHLFMYICHCVKYLFVSHI